jgi:hypothetical protein
MEEERTKEYFTIKIHRTNFEETVYTKEYFRGVDVEIQQQDPENQTGGGYNEADTVPYKHFAYVFENVLTFGRLPNLPKPGESTTSQVTTNTTEETPQENPAETPKEATTETTEETPQENPAENPEETPQENPEENPKETTNTEEEDDIKEESNVSPENESNDSENDNYDSESEEDTYNESEKDNYSESENDNYSDDNEEDNYSSETSEEEYHHAKDPSPKNHQNPGGIIELKFYIEKETLPVETVDKIKLTIYEAQEIAKSLYIQIKYQEFNGKTTNKIRPNKIYRINNRYYLIDPQSLENTKYEDTESKEKQYENVGEVLQSVFPEWNQYKNTKLYYFIKRCIEEKQMLWI